MCIMCPSARTLLRISGAVNSAQEHNDAEATSPLREERERERPALTSLCSLHLGKRLASGTSGTTKERAYARLTLGTTRAIASLRKFATTRVLRVFACPFRPCTRRRLAAHSPCDTSQRYSKAIPRELPT